MLIVILIFLRLKVNSGFRESIFHHGVISVGHSDILFMFLFVPSQ
jgi:hypothetical protein